MILLAGRPEQEAVITLVNPIRVAPGLRPLAYDRRLGEAAGATARRTATAPSFGHTRPDGSTFVQAAERAGYVPWTFLAEDLAAGQPGAAEVAAAWLASPAHRANLLDSRATSLGVGYAADPSSPMGVYWDALLGSQD